VRVAVIFPRFSVLGGGEREIEALALLYPQADIFVLFSVPAMVPPSLRDRTLHTTFLNEIRWINKLAPKLTEYRNVSSMFVVNVALNPAHRCRVSTQRPHFYPASVDAGLLGLVQ
jgi:hypothetical protein